MELFKASHQWSQRPVDERFESLQALHAAVSGYRADAVTPTVNTGDIRVEAREGEVFVAGKTNQLARLTHFAFGQLGQLVKAPVNYLRSLPATLATQNLNHGLAKVVREETQLLLHKNGELVLRGLNSPDYTRIWNADITKRLLTLEEHGWRLPPARPAFLNQPGTRPATEADVLRGDGIGGLSIRVGDPVAPAGAYASDHDMFAFLINENRRIAEPGNPNGLSRGFFVGNWEVPGVAWYIITFLYRNVCGNHIVWGAEHVNEVRIRHTGKADDRAFAELRADIIRYSDESASDDEARIKVAKSHVLGATKDEVLDFIFGQKIADLTRTNIEAAYDLTEEHSDTDGSPRSAWGLAQGLTRVSQQASFADERVKLDRAAGEVIEFAF